MTKFKSYTQAQRKIEEISQSPNVYHTNEGFEIAFTSYDTKEHVKMIAEKLRVVFSNVSIKGGRIQSILVNKVGEKVKGFRIVEVEF